MRAVARPALPPGAGALVAGAAVPAVHRHRRVCFGEGQASRLFLHPLRHAVLEFAALRPTTSMYGVLFFQAGALLQTAVAAVWNATLYLPIALVTVLLRSLLPGCDGRCDGSARFYEVRPARR